MYLSSIISHIDEFLTSSETTTKPIDKLISEYTRKKKYLGSKDRKNINSLTFFVIRNKILLGHLISKFDLRVSSINLAVLLLPQLRNHFSFDKEIISLVEYIISQEASQVLLADDAINEVQDLVVKSKDDSRSLCILYSFDYYFYSFLAKKYDHSQIKCIFESMNQLANTCLRVTNISKITKIANELNQNNVVFELSTIYQNAIILQKRTQLTVLESFKNGTFEVQDLGSQFIAPIVNPQNNELILDACAGGGGKTLHLSDLNPNCKIIASDVNINRLNGLQKRIKHRKNISIEVVNPVKVYRLYDKILLDVPCSGSGTLRRSPFIKNQLTEKQVIEYISLQSKLLDSYKNLCKVGGHLIYATCSIFPQENELQIKQFLANNPNFVPEPLAPSFKDNNINIEISDDDFQLQLLPHLHGTDGFFIAKLKRIS